MEEVQPIRRRKNRFIVWASISIGLVAVVMAVLFWPNNTPAKESPIPASVKSQVAFPIYYPDKQDNWSIDPQSIQSDQGVILYVVKTPDGDINVSQQSKPAGFDFKKFHHQTLTGGTLIIAPVGDGSIGNADGKLIGSLVTDKTWVIATPAHASIKQTQIIQLFNSLRSD